MANPFAAFNVSDDEDDVKPTVVKHHDKPHRSIWFPKQPTRSARHRKNSRNRLLRLHLPPLLLSRASQKKSKTRDILTWRGKSAIVCRKKLSGKVDLIGTSTKDAVAPVDSTFFDK